MKKVLDYSRNNLHWLLSNGAVDSLKKALQLGWQATYVDQIPILPFFADRSLNLYSEFADFWLRRFINRGILSENPWGLTRMGRRGVPEGPIKMPSFNPPTPVSPLSPTLRGKVTIGKKEAKYRLAIDESSLILVSLLPPEIPYFFLLFYYLEGSMDNVYPLIEEGNTVFSIFMGDPTTRLLVPDILGLRRQHAKYLSYLREYIDDPERLLKIIVFYLLSIGQIMRVHVCNGNTLVVTKAGDTIIQQIDLEPLCDKCNMDENRYADFVSIRHRLNYAWQNGELSELFFSKLLNAKLGASLEVYPRISIEGLPHECDVLVLGNEEARLFELKSCTCFDNWCRKGIKQLVENEKVLEKWGIETTTYLVTNIDESIHIKDIDNHLGPIEVLKIDSFI